jgi:hypothetical protein
MNIDKIALKIAKSLVASVPGNVYYHIMDENKKFISVVFNINSKDRDEVMIWFDAMLGRPSEVAKIAEPFGFKDAPGLIDNGLGLDGMTFPICLEGNDESDIEGLIDELKSKYHCNEIK